MKKDIKEFIPIGILDLIGIISIIRVLTTTYIYDYRHYIGLSLILICTILFFINRRIYKYILGLTLIAGTFNLIAFTVTITVIGSFFGLDFQIIPLLILIIYVNIFKVELKRLYKRLFEKSESEKKNNTDKLKDRFKQKFEKLTDTEIESKLTQNLVPEAMNALKELKAERQ